LCVFGYLLSSGFCRRDSRPRLMMFRENPRKFPVCWKISENVTASSKLYQCNCRWLCES
jgi:hypothetical protein